jgi:hypothetical protein
MEYREDRDDVGVLTALMHDNEQSVTPMHPPKLLMGRLLYESAGKM